MTIHQHSHRATVRDVYVDIAFNGSDRYEAQLL